MFCGAYYMSGHPTRDEWVKYFDCVIENLGKNEMVLAEKRAKSEADSYIVEDKPYCIEEADRSLGLGRAHRRKARTWYIWQSTALWAWIHADATIRLP